MTERQDKYTTMCYLRLFFMLFSVFIVSQTANGQNGCYGFFFTKGKDFLKKGQYDEAIKCLNAAKACLEVKNTKKINEADSLIDVVNTVRLKKTQEAQIDMYVVTSETYYGQKQFKNAYLSLKQASDLADKYNFIERARNINITLDTTLFFHYYTDFLEIYPQYNLLFVSDQIKNKNYFVDAQTLDIIDSNERKKEARIRPLGNMIVSVEDSTVVVYNAKSRKQRTHTVDSLYDPYYYANDTLKRPYGADSIYNKISASFYDTSSIYKSYLSKRSLSPYSRLYPANESFLYRLDSFSFKIVSVDGSDNIVNYNPGPNRYIYNFIVKNDYLINYLAGGDTKPPLIDIYSIKENRKIASFTNPDNLDSVQIIDGQKMIVYGRVKKADSFYKNVFKVRIGNLNSSTIDTSFYVSASGIKKSLLSTDAIYIYIWGKQVVYHQDSQVILFNVYSLQADTIPNTGLGKVYLLRPGILESEDISGTKVVYLNSKTVHFFQKRIASSSYELKKTDTIFVLINKKTLSNKDTSEFYRIDSPYCFISIPETIKKYEFSKDLSKLVYQTKDYLFVYDLVTKTNKIILTIDNETYDQLYFSYLNDSSILIGINYDVFDVDEIDQPHTESCRLMSYNLYTQKLSEPVSIKNNWQIYELEGKFVSMDNEYLDNTGLWIYVESRYRKKFNDSFFKK